MSTWVERYVNSQSSMNSHKCSSPLSLASGMSLIKITIESTIAFLYSKPPSSLNMLLKKFILHDAQKIKHNWSSYFNIKETWKLTIFCFRGHFHSQRSVLEGELQTKWSYSFHHNNLEFVSNVRHKICDLFHQSIDTRFIASFQQSSNGKGSYASILVWNQTFHVYVTVCHSHGMRHGHLHAF